MSPDKLLAEWVLEQSYLEIDAATPDGVTFFVPRFPEVRLNLVLHPMWNCPEGYVTFITWKGKPEMRGTFYLGDPHLFEKIREAIYYYFVELFS